MAFRPSMQYISANSTVGSEGFVASLNVSIIVWAEKCLREELAALHLRECLYFIAPQEIVYIYILNLN